MYTTTQHTVENHLAVAILCLIMKYYLSLHWVYFLPIPTFKTENGSASSHHLTSPKAQHRAFPILPQTKYPPGGVSHNAPYSGPGSVGEAEFWEVPESSSTCQSKFMTIWVWEKNILGRPEETSLHAPRMKQTVQNKVLESGSWWW